MESGPYHNRARALGRFLQTGPTGTEGDINLYAYVGNDPLNQVDPVLLFRESGPAQGVHSIT
ncbi:RHS repeat-associated core domain-containing protein [Agrobacterium tumefaciens]|uniref:RHS repeat-associated core domain-containing protein n=1 Tax=Agrobacterium tumefaciens TaxID=358 RepID=UPI0009B6BB67|nr:RHS repeat-associated core domain-containing protein [Agrobacterium tumefaciens]